MGGKRKRDKVIGLGNKKLADKRDWGKWQVEWTTEGIIKQAGAHSWIQVNSGIEGDSAKRGMAVTRRSSLVEKNKFGHTLESKSI